MSTYTEMRSIMMEVDRRNKHNWPPQPAANPSWDFVEMAVYHARGAICGCSDSIVGSLGHLVIHWLENQYRLVRDYPRAWVVWLFWVEGYYEVDVDQKHYMDEWDQRDHTFAE